VSSRWCVAALALLALGCHTAPLSAANAEALGSGRFLVAARQVASPVFAESVVLLIEQNDAGTLGLIVNRPTSIPLGELFPDVEGAREGRAYLGGPVAIDTLRILIRTEHEPEASVRVLDGLYLSSSERAFREAEAAPGAAHRVRAYLGYAGWAAGQLEAEIARGDWHVCSAQIDALFSDHPEALWNELIQIEESIRTERSRYGPPLASASHAISWWSRMAANAAR
jgi:putative transcriptional regulator